MVDETSRSEADINFAAFQKRLPDIIQAHQGQYAVMHAGEIMDFFDTLSDAVKAAQTKFGSSEKFSIQEVTTTNVNLGFYSYAMSPNAFQSGRTSS